MIQRILLTNDDGFDAPGLQKLYTILKEKFQLLIVAPIEEMSGIGHGITMFKEIVVNKRGCNGEFYGYAVKGTPVDCVKLALSELLPWKPDLIISGINAGQNTGTNILYSGTVGAAIEGYLYGIPSLAVSLATKINPDFSFACRFVFNLLENYHFFFSEIKGVININIPPLPFQQIKGICLTRQGSYRIFDSYYWEENSPVGEMIFRLNGRRPVLDEDENFDEGAIRKGFISISPLDYFLTSERDFALLKTKDLSLLLKNLAEI